MDGVTETKDIKGFLGFFFFLRYRYYMAKNMNYPIFEHLKNRIPPFNIKE
jgi:hypothetical protein